MDHAAVACPANRQRHGDSQRLPITVRVYSTWPVRNGCRTTVHPEPNRQRRVAKDSTRDLGQTLSTKARADLDASQRRIVSIRHRNVCTHVRANHSVLDRDLWPPPPDEPVVIEAPPPLPNIIWPRLPPDHPYHLPPGYHYPDNLPEGHPGHYPQHSIRLPRRTFY